MVVGIISLSASDTQTEHEASTDDEIITSR
jgi:hypothetical protein